MPVYNSPMDTESLLVAERVVKVFDTAAGPLEILKGVSLSVSAGDAVAITGPSGCGKSTFLSIVGALDTATSGSVQVDGVDLSSLNENRQATYRNATVGFVFQDHHLLPQCTVLENVLIPAVASGSASQAAIARAGSLLERVGLVERTGHFPGQLSGGERQRVALCRSLINEPKLMLADEPTGNLDPTTAESIGELLLGLGPESGAALLCVTHSMELAAKFPRHVRLSEGTLVED